jgi:hypothetical protein
LKIFVELNDVYREFEGSRSDVRFRIVFSRIQLFTFHL